MALIVQVHQVHSDHFYRVLLWWHFYCVQDSWRFSIRGFV